MRTARTPHASAGSTPAAARGSGTSLPLWFVGSVLAITAAPILLNLAGVDFGSLHEDTIPSEGTGLAGQDPTDFTIRSVSGTLVHTLLEWSATMVAAFAAILAFIHFRIGERETSGASGDRQQAVDFECQGQSLRVLIVEG